MLTVSLVGFPHGQPRRGYPGEVVFPLPGRLYALRCFGIVPVIASTKGREREYRCRFCVGLRIASLVPLAALGLSLSPRSCGSLAPSTGYRGELENRLQAGGSPLTR